MNERTRDRSTVGWAGVATVVAAISLVLTSCQPVRPLSDMSANDRAIISNGADDSTEVSETDHLDAIALVDEASTNTKMGNFEQATELFDEAIEIDPLYADAYLGRGIANFMATRNFQDAYVERDIAGEGPFGVYALMKQDFDRAIEINPSLAEAYFYRAGLYWLWMGLTTFYVPVFMEEAAADAEIYLELYPDGPFTEAVESWVDLDSINPDSYRELYQEDIAEETATIEGNPNDIVAYHERASMHAIVGNADQALQDIRILVRASESNELSSEKLLSFQSFLSRMEADYDPFYFIMLLPTLED